MTKLERFKRKLLAQWIRIIKFEFWPQYVFYLPLIPYIIYLSIRYRGLNTCLAANPMVLGGGLINESKQEILSFFPENSEIARYIYQEANQDLLSRQELIEEFQSELNSPFPIVIKPDVGQRGESVNIIYDKDQLYQLLAKIKYNYIVQEYISGKEYGVFYIKYPEKEIGEIISITQKNYLFVKGNGKQQLQDLILSDSRAFLMYKFFFNKYQKQLNNIIPSGEKFTLAPIGTHCKGAVFLDATSLVTEELTRTIDKMSSQVKGFYFGRYDLKIPTESMLLTGENVKILELNLVGAESTHIYDPDYSIINAYRDLFKQWKIAYQIGSSNLKKGNKSMSLWSFCSELLSYRSYAKRQLK